MSRTSDETRFSEPEAQEISLHRACLSLVLVLLVPIFFLILATYSFDWFVHWDPTDELSRRPPPGPDDFLDRTPLEIFNYHNGYKSFMLMCSLGLGSVSIASIVFSILLSDLKIKLASSIAVIVASASVFVFLVPVLSGGFYLSLLDSLTVKYLFFDIIDLAERKSREISFKREKMETIVLVTTHLVLFAEISIFVSFSTFLVKIPSLQRQNVTGRKLEQLNGLLTAASLLTFTAIGSLVIMCNWSLGFLDPSPRSALQGFASSIGIFWGSIFAIVLSISYLVTALMLVSRAESTRQDDLNQAGPRLDGGRQPQIGAFLNRLRGFASKVLAIVAPVLAAPLAEWLSALQFVE